jgi:cell division transport system permease protein
MRQSPFLCGAAIGTVAVALTILAFFTILVVNIQQLTSQWSKEIQVVAYLEEVPQEERLQEWLRDIRQIPEVESVLFVSRDEAYTRFQKRLAQDADLLEGLGPEFLPASVEITMGEKFRTRQGVETVVTRLRMNAAWKDVRYGHEWLDRFESFLQLIRLGGAILGGFLLFATLFIVANTIKLTLYARRDELEIMSLVGATPLFIKVPFLLEGAIQGGLGGAAALGGAYLIFHFALQEGLTRLLLASGINGIIFLPFKYQLLLLGAGVLLGFFGSLVSLRKFVRI